MTRGSRSQREIEMLWQTRLEQAAKRHGEATLRCLRVLDEHDHLPPSSDGRVAILRAIRDANSAREEHMRVLGVFLDAITPSRLPKNRDEGSLS